MSESENKYIDLCAELVAIIEMQHKHTRRYIKRSFWAMLIIPVVLIIIMVVTGLSKVTVLFVWLLLMFAVCAYVIFLEYNDHRMVRMSDELFGGDKEYDEIYRRAAVIQARHEADAEAEADAEFGLDGDEDEDIGNDAGIENADGMTDEGGIPTADEMAVDTKTETGKRTGSESADPDPESGVNEQ